MPDYQNGKIYKIESLEGDCVYYGSTTQKLCVRKAEHKRNYKDNRGITSERVLCFNDAKIYLVENYPCDSKEELIAREAYYIKNNVCVNKKIPGRTNKQYDIDNKETIRKNKKQHYEKHKEERKKYREEHKENNKIYKKQYYQENKENVLKKNKQYYQENKEEQLKHQKQYYEKIKNNPDYKEKLKKKYICECGNIGVYYVKSRHLKSELHKALISNPFINFKL